MAKFRPLCFFVLIVLAIGCGRSEPVRFRLNLEGRDSSSVSRVQEEAIVWTLGHLFGTPDEPTVPSDVVLDPTLLKMAAGPAGNERGLYRQHCAICHGITGDGCGPAALLMTPYPRDFRMGVFKFTSTLQGAKPSADDLRRNLLNGDPGTAMPLFVELSDRQIDALVEYVKYLSIRGEVELLLLATVVDENTYLPLTIRDVVEDSVEPVAMLWADVESKIDVPPDTPKDAMLADSTARGRELYLSTQSQCTKCHGLEGDGRGEQDELYDDWNRPKKGVTVAQTEERSHLFTLPIRQIHPRNFQRGVFRGGRRPVDLYYRVYAGIKGTPMPAAGASAGVGGVLTPDEIWDVVNYVCSLKDKK